MIEYLIKYSIYSYAKSMSSTDMEIVPANSASDALHITRQKFEKLDESDKQERHITDIRKV